MIGGLSLWVPARVVSAGPPDPGDLNEPLNRRVSPPQLPKAARPQGIDEIHLSPGAMEPIGHQNHQPSLPVVEVPELKALHNQDLASAQRLAQRDRAVRAHENAHRSQAGRYAGAPIYSFRRGSDGRIYAVGGELALDILPVANDPQATVQKMQVLQKAALAPSNASAADRAMAARLGAELSRAQQNIRLDAQKNAAIEAIKERQIEEQEEALNQLSQLGPAAFPVSFGAVDFGSGFEQGIDTAAGLIDPGGFLTTGVGDEIVGESELATSLQLSDEE